MVGANRIGAEVGSNPRDTAKDTTTGIAFSVSDARTMLLETGFTLHSKSVWSWLYSYPKSLYPLAPASIDIICSLV